MNFLGIMRRSKAKVGRFPLDHLEKKSSSSLERMETFKVMILALKTRKLTTSGYLEYLASVSKIDTRRNPEGRGTGNRGLC